jgi:hypothetical protein
MFKSCERVVAAVEEAPKTAKTLATKAERVTYAYYYGRYLLNQCQMVEVSKGQYHIIRIIMTALGCGRIARGILSLPSCSIQE